MKAMVLAAGLGTRLRPLTETWPKPAMPFLGQPLLRYTLSILKSAGVTGVGFNTHHLPHVMEATAKEETARLGLSSTVVHEPVIQGTGGGIRGLASFLSGEKTFVIFNGDILFALALAPLIAEHEASGAAATLLLLPMPEENYGAVEVDEAGRVGRIAGHGPGGEGLRPLHFTGVHLMSPVVFDFMTPGVAEDINREIYPRMMAKGLWVRGALAEGYWSDLGTPKRYLATQADVLTGRVPLEAFGEASPFRRARELRKGLWQVGTEALLGGLQAPVLLDEGARVERLGSVGPQVYLGAGARVGAKARIENAAVLAGAEIPERESLSGVIAWGSHRLG